MVVPLKSKGFKIVKFKLNLLKLLYAIKKNDLLLYIVII